jgi:hypothetical protein
MPLRPVPLCMLFTEYLLSPAACNAQCSSGGTRRNEAVQFASPEVLLTYALDMRKACPMVRRFQRGAACAPLASVMRWPGGALCAPRICCRKAGLLTALARKAIMLCCRISVASMRAAILRISFSDACTHAGSGRHATLHHSLTPACSSSRHTDLVLRRLRACRQQQPSCARPHTGAQALGHAAAVIMPLSPLTQRAQAAGQG